MKKKGGARTLKKKKKKEEERSMKGRRGGGTPRRKFISNNPQDHLREAGSVLDTTQPIATAGETSRRWKSFEKLLVEVVKGHQVALFS